VDISPPQNKSTKIRRQDGVAPILYFKAGSFYNNNQLELEKLINEKFVNDQVKIKHLKITASGNLLIFPDSIIDKNKLLNEKTFLTNFKMLDLGSDEQRYEVLVKGITASNLKAYQSEIDKLQINNIQEIRNKDNDEIKKCKVSFKKKELQLEYIDAGKIQVGLFVFQVEQLAKPLKICYICKSFDHPSSSCKESERCANCGENHNTDECDSNHLKCPNCNENHVLQSNRVLQRLQSF
jgi:hypothetical protein